MALVFKIRLCCVQKVCSPFGEKGNVMAFVCEIVQEKDFDFFKSMGLKNCWGTDPKIFLPGRTEWIADRVRNAFLVAIGGGMHDVPLIYDLWWNGYVVRLEVEDFRSGGNRRESFKLVWDVNKILIPKSIWEKRDLIIKMIEEAMAVNQGGIKKANLNSIIVNMGNATAIEVED